LQPTPQIYEAFTIIALFYLYVIYVSPDETTRERFFGGLERPAGAKSNMEKVVSDGFT